VSPPAPRPPSAPSAPCLPPPSHTHPPTLPPTPPICTNARPKPRMTRVEVGSRAAGAGVVCGRTRCDVIRKHNAASRVVSGSRDIRLDAVGRRAKRGRTHSAAGVNCGTHMYPWEDSGRGPVPEPWQLRTAGPSSRIFKRLACPGAWGVNTARRTHLALLPQSFPPPVESHAAVCAAAACSETRSAAPPTASGLAGAFPQKPCSGPAYRPPVGLLSAQQRQQACCVLPDAARRCRFQSP